MSRALLHPPISYADFTQLCFNCLIRHFLLSDMGLSILAATIAAAASATVGIILSGDGVAAKTGCGHGTEPISLNCYYPLQHGASDHSQGFKDKNFGISPSLLGQ